VPDVDVDTQRAVAAYLDAETARIDRLIATTASTVRLLRERQQAEVAAHFLPQDLPAGWVMMKLKRVATFRSGDAITSDSIEAEGQYPVFGGNGVRGFTARYNYDGFYPLVGRQGALCGNLNYGQGRFWASEHAVVVRPLSGIDPMWLGELLRALDLNQYSLTAAQPGLAVDQVENLVVPVPRQPRQSELARWVSVQTARTSAIAKGLQARMGLLQERRQALITAAVTGEIAIPGVAT
jgi:type I restriction enzyme S subunit